MARVKPSEMMMKTKQNCYNCRYMREVPRNTHVKCVRFFFIKDMPEQDEEGVKNGWCFFPALYDPVWLGRCVGFEDKDKTS